MRSYWAGATVALLLACALVMEANGQEAAANNAENEEVSAAGMQPVSEDPVKYVHVLNPGEREFLSPNLIGLQNMAMTFLPLSLNFINVVDAYREVVNGIRYDIILNAVDTKASNADIVCHLVILEKPWLRTEWGDKVRDLDFSNCTADASAEGADGRGANPYAKANAINDKYVRSSVFNGGSRNELSADEMKRLEDQILPSAISSKRVPSSNTLRIDSQPQTPEEVTAKSSDVGVATSNPSDASQESTTAQPPEETSTSEPSSNADEKTEEELTESSASSPVSTTAVPELSEDEKKWLDDFFSLGALNFENNLSGVRPADSQDDASNTQQQQQQEQIDQEPIVRARRSADSIVGGVTSLDNEKAEKILSKSLSKLATGEGPSYKVLKVHAATKQLVSGTLTKIDCDLVDAEGNKARCEVQIWSKAWESDGNEVTINCPDKPLIKERHSRSVEYAQKKTHKKQNHHSLNKVEHLFSKFQLKFKKHYHTTIERQMRLRIFKQNLKLIQQLNEHERGSAKYGITEFSDMTSTEYKQRTGLWQRDPVKAASNAKAVIPDIELPKEFDWREKGAVTPVKNQGNCGSCWAFSVTGNLEGLHAAKTGVLEQYSEQELLDCDTSDSACNGGLPDNAFDAIEKIGGLELEGEYPYHGRKEQCHYNKDKVHVRVKGHVDLPKNETAIAQWLVANGPISIGINANAMQFYRGGVSHPWHFLCSSKNLDHGVLIVGYGISEYPSLNKSLPYWIIKNSWGSKWGEQGYYRVYRGDNTCGVSEMVSSAVLADGED